MAFMDFGEQISRMIYTTNPVEALHRVMRKVTKANGAWINDKSLLKHHYLALNTMRIAGNEKHFHGQPYKEN